MRRRWISLLTLGAAVAGGFVLGKSRGHAAESRPKWAAFRLADLEERQARGDDPWLEFFRTSTLRTGLYVLPAGAKDPQGPHQQDEVYYLIKGRAVLTVDGEEHPVAPGAVIFVRAGIDHRFHSITEELEVLVFFAG
jgi:mannose-6-phosphate isomerase-like protein (cupin superfamily)